MRTLALTCLTLIAIATPRALAQEEPPPEGAQELIEQARAHEAADRPALAAQRYLEVYELMREANMSRAPILLWNAGTLLRQVPGRERDAIDTLQRFLDESTTLTDIPEVRDFRSEAVAQIEELETRVGSEETVEGASSDEAPDDDSEAAPTRVSPVGPIVLAIGGAALIGGAIVGGISLAQADELRPLCDDPTACPTRLRPQYDEMRTFSAVADALMVAGGIVAATGLLFVFTMEERVEPDDAGIVASCSPLGCSLEGRF